MEGSMASFTTCIRIRIQLKFASKSDCIDAAQKVSIENATYTCESIKVLAK